MIGSSPWAVARHSAVARQSHPTSCLWGGKRPRGRRLGHVLAGNVRACPRVQCAGGSSASRSGTSCSASRSMGRGPALRAWPDGEVAVASRSARAPMFAAAPRPHGTCRARGPVARHQVPPCSALPPRPPSARAPMRRADARRLCRASSPVRVFAAPRRGAFTWHGAVAWPACAPSATRDAACAGIRSVQFWRGGGGRVRPPSPLPAGPSLPLGLAPPSSSVRPLRPLAGLPLSCAPARRRALERATQVSSKAAGSAASSRHIHT